jgi:putative DNA primase/helicase
MTQNIKNLHLVDGETGEDQPILQFENLNEQGAEHDRQGEAARVPELSDEFLALKFAGKHADDLKFVDQWGKWFYWDRNVWREDTSRIARDRVRAVCREVAAGISKDRKNARRVCSTTVDNAVLTKATADRLLAATVKQWDADPYLLNTPNGVADLHTMKMRKNRPMDHLTKMTSVSPDPLCSIDQWKRFLYRVTGGDAAFVNYLRRLGGYMLTGSIEEHEMFFLHGFGANGKTTFVRTIAGILDTYAVSTPIETFTLTHQDRHPTELARLFGARLVTATETEEGRPWAESRLKQLTGGDTISARFMRQDFFDFAPQFKILLMGNHKPSVRSVDEAIKRRLKLIPFTVTIPRPERDPELIDKLKAEWPGILYWMIGGYVEWRKVRNLCPPTAVVDATNSYLEAEDAVAAWMADWCEPDKTAWENSTALFASFKAWAEANGEYVGNQRRLAQSLERERTMKARGFRGLRLTGDARRHQPHQQ